MKKFDKLLEKIKFHDNSELDVGDFGLNYENIQQLVEKVNNNQKITILVLQHNSLGDDSVEFLMQLKNITSLDISYNNFTQKGIDRLEKVLKEKCDLFNIYAKHNNNNPLLFSNQAQDAIDTYAAVLAEVMHTKWLQINPTLTPEQIPLLKDRLIQILACDSKIFELESSHNQSPNKLTI